MCCFGMTKLLAIKLVGEAPSLLSVNEWISGFRSVLLNYGKDKSDSKTVYKSPLMRTWRAGLKTGFFSWLMLVVVWVLNDGLPSVLLFDTLGSFSFCVCAAAMLIAVVFSDLRRDLVGPALFRVASSCWQHCFFCLSALVGFSCISFPGRIKGEIEGKNDWKPSQFVSLHRFSRSGDLECFQWDPGGCSCACHVLREAEGFPVCSCVCLVLLWCGSCMQLCFKYSSGRQH